jgi:hypothetical protein
MIAGRMGSPEKVGEIVTIIDIKKNVQNNSCKFCFFIKAPDLSCQGFMDSVFVYGRHGPFG